MKFNPITLQYIFIKKFPLEKRGKKLEKVCTLKRMQQFAATLCCMQLHNSIKKVDNVNGFPEPGWMLQNVNEQFN